jgi:hypothetical protein
MKRDSPYATPEEALRGVDMSASHREGLIRFMRDAHPDLKRCLDITYLPIIRCSPQERLDNFAQAKDALASLTSALDASFRHDLFDAAKTEQEEELVGRFLELLPAMMEITNRVTEQRIRQRWSGANGRAARKIWNDFETDFVRGSVRHSGFNVDPPDAIALEVLRRVLSYVTKTSLTISAVRKRIAADDKRVAAEAKRDAEEERITAGGKL